MKQRYFIFLICSLMLIQHMSLIVDAAEDYHNNYYIDCIEDILTNNDTESIEIEETDYLNVMYNNIINGLEKDSRSVDKYPSYYGGAYISDESKLVVLLKEDTPVIRQHIVDIAGDYETTDIAFINSKYSYEELYSMKASISNKISDYKKKMNENSSELCELINSIAGVGIIESENSILIHIRNLADNTEELFRQYILNYDNIYFEEIESPPINNATTPLYPGSGVYVLANGNWVNLSVGYRVCRLNDEGTYDYGFVTAGHGIELNDGVYLLNHVSEASFIGRIKARKMSGNVDAAFVSISTDKFHVATKVKHGDSHGNRETILTGSYFVTLSEGVEAIKNGNVTYRTTGKVKSSSYDSTDENGITITDCIMANYKAKPGDSGGIVYAEYTTGDYLLAGIHKGSNEAVFAWNRISVIVKAINIRSELGVIYYQ